MTFEDVCFELLCFDDLFDLGVIGVLSELLPSVLPGVVVLLVDRRFNWRRRVSLMIGIVYS